MPTRDDVEAVAGRLETAATTLAALPIGPGSGNRIQFVDTMRSDSPWWNPSDPFAGAFATVRSQYGFAPRGLTLLDYSPTHPAPPEEHWIAILDPWLALDDSQRAVVLAHEAIHFAVPDVLDMGREFDTAGNYERLIVDLAEMHPLPDATGTPRQCPTEPPGVAAANRFRCSMYGT